MERTYCVYTMSNVAKRLYAGVTNNLEERVFQYKSKQTAGYTQKYKLVYFEPFANIRDAIGREEQIERWLRSPKNCAHRKRKSGLEGFSWRAFQEWRKI